METITLNMPPSFTKPPETVQGVQGVQGACAGLKSLCANGCAWCAGVDLRGRARANATRHGKAHTRLAHVYTPCTPCTPCTPVALQRFADSLTLHTPLHTLHTHASRGRARSTIYLFLIKKEEEGMK